MFYKKGILEMEGDDLSPQIQEREDLDSCKY